MRNILFLMIIVLLTGCASKMDLINSQYLKVSRYDGINRNEAIAIARYYFQYKQSAFQKSGAISINQEPEELKNSWKFRIISKVPNIDVHVFYLIDKNNGQVTESSEKTN